MTDTAPVSHALAELRTEDIAGVIATLTLGGYRMVALPSKDNRALFAIEDALKEQAL